MDCLKELEKYSKDINDFYSNYNLMKCRQLCEDYYKNNNYKNNNYEETSNYKNNNYEKTNNFISSSEELLKHLDSDILTSSLNELSNIKKPQIKCLDN